MSTDNVQAPPARLSPFEVFFPDAAQREACLAAMARMMGSVTGAYASVLATIDGQPVTHSATGEWRPARVAAIVGSLCALGETLGKEINQRTCRNVLLETETGLAVVQRLPRRAAEFPASPFRSADRVHPSFGVVRTSLIRRRSVMSNIKESLAKLLEIDGAIAAAVVDSTSGLLLGKEGSGLDLDLAGAGNTEVVRAKLKTMRSLNLDDKIEDILITLDKQYHIIRPVDSAEGLFIYLVLVKERANLALARRKVLDVETQLSI